MLLPKLSINLVIYNGEKYLPFCLASLKRQTFQDFELKIINNGSFDKSLDFVAENFPQLKVISYASNIGFAKAHNQLISWTKNPYVMILNQDVILEPDFIEKIISFLDQSNAATAMGKILKWDYSANKKTNYVDSLGIKILPNHQAVDSCQGEKDETATEPQEIFGVSGAVAIFKRDVLEKIKVKAGSKNVEKYEYFDEDFFSYKEDVDLAYRLQLAGEKSYLIPSAIAYHQRTVASSKEQRASREHRPAGINIYSYKNHLHVIVKNEFCLNKIRFFWPIFWYEFKKLSYLFLFERSTLKGVKMFFAEYGKMKQKRKFIIKNIRKIKARDLAQWYI